MNPEMLFRFAWSWLVNFFTQTLPQLLLPNLQLIVNIMLLVVAGYIVGRIVKAVMVKLLGVVGLKRITTRTWAESILRATGYKGTIVELIGDMVKWLIYILFLAVIIQTLGLPGVADLFTQIAIFMPRFIGAILIIVIGFIIADFFGKVFEEAGRHFLDEDILSKLSGGLVKYSLALIAIIMALSLIGLETSSLTVLFTLILASVVVTILVGIRDIFPNFAAGLHLKKALKPGECIKTGRYSGIVEKVEAFSVTIRCGKKKISIPNTMLINNPIEKGR